MAYAAVTCLRSTIQRLLTCSRISVVSSTRRNLELAYEELGSLQKVLERSGGGGSSSRLNALDGQIIGVVQELEDSLEFHELNSSLSESYGEFVMDGIDCSVEMVKKMKQEYNEELVINSLPDQRDEDEDDHGDNDFEESPMDEEEEDDDDEEEEEEEEEEDEEDDDDSDYHDEEEENSDEEQEEEDEEKEEDGGDGDDSTWAMVGLSDTFNEIKQSLVQKKENTYVYSIVGMAGIGKTALARRIFHDPFISKKFECRAFIRVGQNYECKQLIQAILAQVNPCNNELEMDHKERLNEYLDKKRYLIVLDDVWNFGFWDDYFKNRRRDKAARGSRILLTTRVEEIALSLGRATYFYMPFLNKQESWDLLREKVFPNNICPHELEKAGKDIAEKCEGLPLLLVTIADILSKSERTPEYWNKALQKKNSVFEDAHDRILQVLYPSYYNLSPQEKSCFLYMGAFPQRFEIRRSKLVNLWCTEGFLEADDTEITLDCFASECFDKLLFDHIVVPAADLSSDGQDYQACSLHSVFRHLCRKELESNGFLHIIEGRADCSTESKGRKRRIAIYNNVLLSLKGVYTSMDASLTHSLLCSGAYHQYQVPINFNLRLLRVCDALTIRFYEFPYEVLMLVQLRYFAITCNENLPHSIAKLWKLEYLIVHQHLSIHSTLADSYLPVEIWDLQELRHLQIIGRNMPNPPSKDVVLKHLVKLLDVGMCSCNEGVIRSLPNLQKLRIQIQLTLDLVETLSYLSNTSHLDGLLSLQCVIVNPLLESNIIAKPSLSITSTSIEKLTLNGLGYPWECMNTFVRLPNLRVLKLLMYAFQGEKWEVEEKGFLKLKCLTIEDSDLVQWKVGDGAFPVLSHLTLKSCYKLEEIPKISSLHEIELVDCNSVVEACAEKMDCYVSYSWDDDIDPINYISKVYTTY